MSITLTAYPNKNIAIYGLGITGIASARALSKGGANILAWDAHERGREYLLEQQLERVTLQDPSEYDWSNIELLVLSAGVPLTHPQPHPVVVQAQQANCPIICDIELLYGQYPNAPYIGVTGTNGKSTTVSLIHHIFNYHRVHSQLGGNIGISGLDLNPPKQHNEDCIILEMSSFQLDLIDKMRFSAAVLLNLTPDHLDRHGDMQHYLKAKLRIFNNQQPGDLAIYDGDSPYTQSIEHYLAPQPSSKVPFSVNHPIKHGLSLVDNLISDLRDNFRHKEYRIDIPANLTGKHNAQNILAALITCQHKNNLTVPECIEALPSFQSLSHRMETIAQIGKITFVNDSKATNAQATMGALSGFDNIYWIAGGVAKEEGIAPLTPLFERITHSYLIGQSAPQFGQYLEQHHVKSSQCGHLEQAVLQAYHHALQQNIPATILLSPACASFDQWKNFAARGEAFRHYIEALPA